MDNLLEVFDRFSPIVLTKLQTLIAQVGKHRFDGRLLAVDPGETTGITVLDQRHPDNPTFVLAAQAQLKTWPFEDAVHNFHDLFTIFKPTFMVFEAYHVYKWRLQEHTFSQVPTIQIIGALKTWAVHFGVPYIEQTAQTGKAFFTDSKLKMLDMFIAGQPHARDSLRHAATYLTFGGRL